MKNIVITGGAGYLGSKLVSMILSMTNCWDDVKIIIYDTLLYNQTNLISECNNSYFEFIYGDVRDEQKLLQYIKQADIIYPLAGIVGFPACDKDKELATAINTNHIKFIVDNISKDQRLIYPNTNSGYGIGKGDKECTEDMELTPITHYGVTKCDAENYVLDSGNGIVLRLATVFGVSPRMRIDLLVNNFVYKAMKDGYLVLFEKDFKRNYIHIEDVCNIFIDLACDKLYNSNNNEIFNVGLPNNYSKLKLANLIKKYIPNLSINIDEYNTDPDKRNYIVSNEKIKKIGLLPTLSVEYGIKELMKAYTIMLNCNREFTNV